MIYILIICGTPLVISWYLAELKGKLGLRLLVGLLAFAVVGILSFQGGRTKPAFENEDLRACLSEIRSALEKGETKRVEAAYREYATNIAQGYEEYASRRMMLMELRSSKPR